MNTGSMPTPGPNSNANTDEAKTPQQKTFAYRMGRVVQQLDVFHILGLGIFLAILSFMAFQRFAPVNAGLIVVVVGTLAFVLFVRLIAPVRWCGDRIERHFNRKPTEAPTPAPQDGSNWKTYVVVGFLLAMRANGAIQREQYEAGQQARARQLQAKMSYWQTSVADFHQIRFQLPAGDEHAGKFYEDMFNSLRQLTDRVKAATTADVDQDLVAMAIRHLAVEDRMIQFKADVEELMKQENIPAPAGTDTMDQRMTQWQSIVARIDADPSIFDNLPQGPMRTLLETVFELDQLRLDQLREIEIMQAVLQERYPGTKFPLPEVGP